MKADGKTVLVVDDEAAMRHMLCLVLRRSGYEPLEAENGRKALDVLAQQPCAMVLCDIRMPGMDGLAFLGEALARSPQATVIMMSAYGTLDTAVECLKAGAFDYISKPFKPDEVVLTLRKAEERLRLQRENALLRQELRRDAGGREIIHDSPAMGQVLELVGRVAPAPSPVLITGETGTGKELVARALHSQSPRRSKAFVAVNCGAISPHLLESELFGHVRGSFTGADRAHDGLFAAADGGTLFLDEIGDLPLALQPKLLRALQEGEVRPVGAVKPRRLDVRVVAATACNLTRQIEQGCFRSDLFFRLAVVEIQVPPLRERPTDIPLLAQHFLRRIALREGRPPSVLAPDAVALLQCYHWPGNVRELANFMEKTTIFNRADILHAADLPGEMRRRPRPAAEQLSLKEAQIRIEREYIRKALAATDGNRTQAAKMLEISLRNLQYKIKQYHLE